jgi:hypothetical protein
MEETWRTTDEAGVVIILWVEPALKGHDIPFFKASYE